MNIFRKAAKMMNIITNGINPMSSNAAERSIWQRFIEDAETYNEPGRFSAMTGFEYSPTPSGNNLHRVVVFADGPDKTNQTVPFSLFDSENPEDLWKYLAAYEADTGGRALARSGCAATAAGMPRIPTSTRV